MMDDTYKGRGKYHSKVSPSRWITQAVQLCSLCPLFPSSPPLCLSLCPSSLSSPSLFSPLLPPLPLSLSLLLSPPPLTPSLSLLAIGRLLNRSAELESVKLVFVIVYASTAGLDRLVFVDVLEEVVASCNSDEFLFLGGDFNCTELPYGQEPFRTSHCIQRYLYIIYASPLFM